MSGVVEDSLEILMMRDRQKYFYCAKALYAWGTSALYPAADNLKTPPETGGVLQVGPRVTGGAPAK
jgi:hypothetical protein